MNWTYINKLTNCGPEPLTSGKKVCENRDCEQPADHVVETGTAIYFACDGCAPLIPNGKIIRSRHPSDSVKP